MEFAHQQLACSEMDLVSRSLSLSITTFNSLRPSACPSHPQSFPIYPLSSSFPKSSLTTSAKRRDSYDQPVLKKPTIEEGEEEEDDRLSNTEDFEDEIIMDDDEDFEDEFEEEEENLYAGDGGGGGGVSLAGTVWDKEALKIAEEVSISFDGDLRIYAFKTSANFKIYLRIEKMSSKYGSPSMTDIEVFSRAYRLRLDEAELAGTIPKDISFEVSSPGLERVVRVPEDLERFKDSPMFVKYVDAGTGAASPQENEGVLKLISFDLESCHCTWGIADVKVNRQKAGKGRPLSKKQRDWRLQTPFESLRLVRRYSDF